MTTFQTLQNRVRSEDRDCLLEKLGYHNRARGEETIGTFVSTPSLYEWIRTGHYDMKYSAESFYKKLCALFRIDAFECDEALEKARGFLDKVNRSDTPHIYIDTGFRRKSEPIHVLAFMESRRRIMFQKEHILSQSLEKTLDEVAETVREHYSDNNGTLPLWGEIRRYVYHHTDGRRFVFNPDGTLDEDTPEVAESRARIAIGSKTLEPGCE